MIDVFKKLNIITAKGELNKKAVHLVQSFSGLEQEVNILTDFMPIDTPLNIRLKLIKDGITANPVCAHPNCNNLTQYKMAKSKFDEYCCPQCYRTDPTAYQKQHSVMMERYGVVTINQLESGKDRFKATNLKKHGVDHPMKLQQFKDKVQKSKEENDPGSLIATAKRRVTNLSKYGTPTYAASLIDPDSLSKMNDVGWITKNWVTMYRSGEDIIKELGISLTTWYRHLKLHNIDRQSTRYSMLLHLKQQFCGDITRLTDIDWLKDMVSVQGWGSSDVSFILNVDSGIVRKQIKIYNIQSANKKSRSISSYELELREFVTSNYTGKIIFNDRQSIAPKELDILLPELNLAIEMNGVSYHSEVLGGKGRKYHINKHLECERSGIRLIQIWGNEWKCKKDIVKGRLLSIFNSSARIFARKCEIIALANLESSQFFDSNHMQGDSSAPIVYGLTYRGKVVAAISFGSPRFGTTHQYELIRYCNKIGTNVVGGASRLLNHFIRQYNPTSIITYSAVRWNTGNMYSKLGFSHIGRSKPGYYYFHTSNCNEMFHRFKFQKHKLASILSSFDPTLSEFENMLNHGYDRIWDCGNDSFEWINKI